MKSTATFVILILSGFSALATVYHSDGSAANVQALHNAALNGDTITLPAGTFTWSIPVTISKAIKIQGEGSGRIIGWSRSSETFGTGAKTFVVQNGFTAATGTNLRIWRIATNKETSYMLGTVTSVLGTILTVNVTSNTGSGSASLWLIATESSTRVSHGAGANSLLSLRESTAGDVEVSGIQFTTATGTGPLVTLNYSVSGNPTLIHDCWFYQTAEGVDIIRDLDTNRGVIWNCSFAWSFWAQSNSQALHFPLNNRTEVWSSRSTMGMADSTGANNFYVEDCDFHGGIGVSDFDSNSKVVWRHNINDHAGLASHGYDTSAYGTRHWEIYDNQFLFANLGDCDGSKTLNLINHMLLRGGTGVIANNYIEEITSCAWGNKPEIQFGVWCLGRWSQSPGAYDADDDCTPHYPAPRQFGFGRVTGSGVDGQGHTTSNGVYVGDLEPAYIWGNTGFQPAISVTTDGSACTTNQYGHVPDNPNNYIQSGREYIAGVKPGYTKFTYPHPLRSGSPTPTPIPTATPTATPTPTPTFAPSPTATVPPSPTPIPSPTSTPTPTPVAGGTNVALAANGGVASASSTYNNNTPVEAVIDGDRLGLNWGNGGGWADGTPNVWPDWVEIDFNAIYPINEIDFFTVQDNYQNPGPPALDMTFTVWGVTDFDVQYWTGSTWTDIPGGYVTGNNHVWRQFTFADITTAKIRILINNSLAGSSRVTEIEAYRAGENPTPTPTPNATATPTPTPTPDQCEVPNFIGIRIRDAQSVWNDAGFTTEVITSENGGGHLIIWQSLPEGFIGSCSDTTITVE